MKHRKRPLALSVSTITELAGLYHDKSVRTDSAADRGEHLDGTHIELTLLPSPQWAAISGSQAGSQGAVTGLLGLAETLSISSLIPSYLAIPDSCVGLHNQWQKQQ